MVKLLSFEIVKRSLSHSLVPGTGGPGRYLAWEYPVDVVGVEYNQELARVSSLLSRLLCVPSLSFPFPSPTSNPTPSRSSLSPSVSKVPGTFSVAVGDATKFDVQKHNLEGRVDSIISQVRDGCVCDLMHKDSLFFFL